MQLRNYEIRMYVIKALHDRVSTHGKNYQNVFHQKMKLLSLAARTANTKKIKITKSQIRHTHKLKNNSLQQFLKLNHFVL
jgi:uncharacterized protein YlaI